jgi:putative two-component system response regulator
MHALNRVLAVDDNPTNLAIIEEALQGRFNLRLVPDGSEAIQLAESFQPDVALVDVMMPGLDGFQVCSQLKNDRSLGHPHVLMVSAKTDLDSRLRGYQAGADDYVTKPFNEDELFAKVCAGLRTHASFGLLHCQLQMMSVAAGEALELVSLLRDAETSDHLVRVRDYAQLLASELRVSPWRRAIDDVFLDDLYRASPLHDIGKVGIPDAILHKRTQLTDVERVQMQQHTLFGQHILSRLATIQPKATMFQMAANIARSHHENYDGSGYPDRLAGENIPLAARIVKVADVFDAVTSKRRDRSRFSPQHARDVIVSGNGSSFDPVIVDAMLRVCDEFAAICESAHQPLISEPSAL